MIRVNQSVSGWPIFYVFTKYGKLAWKIGHSETMLNRFYSFQLVKIDQHENDQFFDHFHQNFENWFKNWSFRDQAQSIPFFALRKN